MDETNEPRNPALVPAVPVGAGARAGLSIVVPLYNEGAGLECLQETRRPCRTVHVDRVLRAAWPAALACEGNPIGQRRRSRTHPGGVGEQVVTEVLDSFPAVPFQRAGLVLPRPGGRLTHSADSEPHSEADIVRGNRRTRRFAIRWSRHEKNLAKRSEPGSSGGGGEVPEPRLGVPVVLAKDPTDMPLACG